MRIILDNETITLSGTTVVSLIAQASPQKPFAVAISTQFVAKGAHAETVLDENDKVGIVCPIVGG